MATDVARSAAYSFILANTLRACTGISSSVYVWQLREIRVRLHEARYKDDASFVQDLVTLLCTIDDDMVYEAACNEVQSTLNAMHMSFTIPPPRGLPKAPVATKLDAAAIVLQSHDLLKKCVRVSHGAAPVKTSASKLPKPITSKPSTPAPSPSPEPRPTHTEPKSKQIRTRPQPHPVSEDDDEIPPPKRKVGRPPLIPLEPHIVDDSTLERLQVLRALPEQELCPHLQKARFSMLSVKRERLLSSEAMGMLRDGRIVAFQPKETLTFEDFFKREFKTNRRGLHICSHIYLLSMKKSLDLHLLVRPLLANTPHISQECDHYAAIEAAKRGEPIVRSSHCKQINVICQP
ncbi:hypothetical protein ACHHYP_07366 [Achlya hypogyna]|uniref:Uncharacterized protein n=1 Tax=Achlya hypogyna TaxID=1202772 RepID=A0A1V9ZLV7_ACHHY|nr:hypothetical protein ACHHYP_07366 [Achlya hypogyna]